MARKRMFDSEIINQESFLTLPMESKALYFLLGMEADDEGFVSPTKVLRLYGGSPDAIRVLIAKNFIIPFGSGVVVITDWKRNNYLDKKRVKPTIYQDEKLLLNYNEETEKYECLTDVKQMLNQNSIEENNNIINNTINNMSSKNAQPTADLKKEDVINIQNITNDVIGYLNKISGHSFSSSSSATKRLISARLKEKFTVDEIKDVIYYKYQEWCVKPFKFNNGKMSDEYFRPNTLFNAKNFENYLEEYKRWQVQ